MKRKIIFTEKEADALIGYLNSDLSCREAGKKFGCSYEQIRLLAGKIALQLQSEGKIEIKKEMLIY